MELPLGSQLKVILQSMLQKKNPKSHTWENKHFPMKWPHTNWKSGNSKQSSNRRVCLQKLKSVHLSIFLQFLGHPGLWAASAPAGEHMVSTAAGMDGGRTCWAGCYAHQPAEVFRLLNCSNSLLTNLNEASCLFLMVCVRLGLASAAWTWTIFSPSAEDCSALSHRSQLPRTRDH